MTIIFEAQNANEDFVKLMKSVAKLANVKIKTQKFFKNSKLLFEKSQKDEDCILRRRRRKKLNRHYF